MRTKLMSVAALAIATGAAVATPAHATTTVGECRVLIEDLSANTAAATSLGRAGAGLVAKADAAAIKLDENKTADALEKLLDYDSTLDALLSAAKPKVSEIDHATLNTEVEAAIACIGDISAV
jgi:hypothetical protein